MSRGARGGGKRRYDAPGNRAAGIDSPDVWRFAALIDPSRVDAATPETRRKAMQTLCAELWQAYELAFRALREEEPRYLARAFWRGVRPGRIRARRGTLSPGGPRCAGRVRARRKPPRLPRSSSGSCATSTRTRR